MSADREKATAPQERPATSEAPLSRRGFLEFAALTGVSLTATGAPLSRIGDRNNNSRASEDQETTGENKMSDEITKERIRRACLSGPASVTDAATVAEMDAQGKMIVLRQGTNQWVCMPGNENIIGNVPMCLDPMGMQWYMDIRARKPKPTNATPGLIYMLCGATQRSYTDPFDTTSPAIPIGPHWMVIWPFDPVASGLPTVMRDAGTMIMFAGTPWAHLHICGSPLDGNEYHPGDRAVSTLTYAQPQK